MNENFIRVVSFIGKPGVELPIELSSIVDVPKMKGTIIWTPMFERYVVNYGPKNGHQKDMCWKEMGVCAQKHANHSRLNSQHDWEHLYAHLTTTIFFFSLRTNKIFVSCAGVLYPTRGGCIEKSIHLRHIHLNLTWLLVGSGLFLHTTSSMFGKFLLYARVLLSWRIASM